MGEHRDEMYREQKQLLLDRITKSKEALQLYQKCVVTFGREWFETIALEKELFNELVQDLIALKRWFIKNGGNNARL